eukprot:Nitzschia sp. Nitz4//scaffold7_size249615//182554//184512//NITZ4_001196-RA/size249615-processed-gene-0.307-mRNA-1//1//CDS//3329558499//7026//frame0
MDNQDMFSKLGGDNAMDAADLNLDRADLVSFNDSSNDFFDKFLADEVSKDNGLLDNNMLLSGDDSTLEAMLRSDDKPSNADSMNFDTKPSDFKSTSNSDDYNMSEEVPQQSMNVDISSASASAPQAQPGPVGQDRSNWFQASSAAAQAPSQSLPQNSMLDAAPLNISLGGGHPSSSSLASNLRRKGSHAQLGPAKLGAVRKAHTTSSKIRSTMSEGMLARALKARYNSGSNLNKYNVNAATANAVISSKLQQKAMSTMNVGSTRGAISQHLSRSSFHNRNSRHDLVAVERQGASGGKNATWGAGPLRKPDSNMFANLLGGPGSSGMMKPSASSGLGASGSSLGLRMQQHKLGASGSRSSMQDLLRLSKKQSKTQTLLRQSSAQTLLRQTSAQNLRKGPSQKVDLSSLLPPQHAAMHNGTHSHGPVPKIPSSPKGADAQSNNAVESLLHQSCRLYPTTAAVVESALRIDPEAVRKAVPVTVEKGKKLQNVYGYPVNVAMTHGGSQEVIEMLIKAGPDVLIRKDGNDGAGSLGIALVNGGDNKLVDMLIQANPECVTVADRKGNYPLHVAVNYGRPLELVKRLHTLFPGALQKRNFHSQTPLDIAQISTRCSEEVMNYLQSAAFSSLERNAQHVGRPHPNDLEDGLDDIMKTNF